MNLSIITKNCSPFRDTVSLKNDIMTYDIQIDQPPAWELSNCSF